MKNWMKLVVLTLVIGGLSACSSNDDTLDNGYMGDGSIAEELDCEYLKARLGTYWTFDITTEFFGFPAQTQQSTSTIEADTTYLNQYLVCGNSLQSPGAVQLESCTGCDGMGLFVISPESITLDGTTLAPFTFQIRTDLSEGEEWEAAVIEGSNAQFNYQSRYVGTVLDENASLTVPSGTYDNVLVVQLQTFYSDDFVTTDEIEVSRVDYYLVPEISLVKAVVYTQDITDPDLALIPGVTQELVEYVY